MLLTVSFSFGWVNASYVYGLAITNAHMRRALGALIPYNEWAKHTSIPEDGDADPVPEGAVLTVTPKETT
jgi:hypothetical protein